ncbi:MAG: 50S ribosomal protein L19 [Chloroflexota bacterium]
MNIASLVPTKTNRKIPALAPGDTVKVHSRIVEGGKERIQVYQGVVIGIKHGGNSASFTVRHVAFGVGVERTFPYASPRVEKVEVLRHGKVRRAKLYYLRERSGKSARLKERRIDPEKLRLMEEAGAGEEPEEETVPQPEAEVTEVAAEAEAPEAEEVSPPESELKEAAPEETVAEATSAETEEKPEAAAPEAAEAPEEAPEDKKE